MDLKTLPVEKKIQPVSHSPATNHPDVDVVTTDSAKPWNQCMVILDSGASVNVFYNKDLIEDIWYVADPKEVTTGRCTKMFYN